MSIIGATWLGSFYAIFMVTIGFTLTIIPLQGIIITNNDTAIENVFTERNKTI
jgi:hypothetical protein